MVIVYVFIGALTFSASMALGMVTGLSMLTTLLVSFALTAPISLVLFSTFYGLRYYLGLEAGPHGFFSPADQD